jgi:hypothetical protein
MQTNETIKATGQLNIVLTDSATGEIKYNTVIPNLVVSVGKSWIASRMKDTGIPTQMTHMAIGQGTNGTDTANTTLQSELGRVSLTTAGGTVTSNVVSYAASFGAGTGTGAVTEAGIFNDGTTGTMLCRTVFPVVNKGANDSMSVTWTVTLS